MVRSLSSLFPSEFPVSLCENTKQILAAKTISPEDGKNTHLGCQHHRLHLVDGAGHLRGDLYVRRRELGQPRPVAPVRQVQPQHPVPRPRLRKRVEPRALLLRRKETEFLSRERPLQGG